MEDAATAPTATEARLIREVHTFGSREAAGGRHESGVLPLPPPPAAADPPTRMGGVMAGPLKACIPPVAPTSDGMEEVLVLSSLRAVYADPSLLTLSAAWKLHDDSPAL